jgi:hypothetical protein
VKWFDRLMGSLSSPETEREHDERAIQELDNAFDHVHRRHDRLVKELNRVNKEMRQKLAR